ncbi:hypothetical protein ACFU98_26430 [Streptomyces sp. NPDC057575]|uniref:hypothetical protein n=1 Tax=unclassified Streptomyces TaxID=2593676 RepID=UPI0036CF9BC2
MFRTKTTVIAMGAAALLAAGGVTATTAQASADTASSPQILSTKGSSIANTNFGYAHATWKWTGAGKTGKVKVYVNDQMCSDHADTFAFMQFKGGRWGNSITDGESRARNYNSDCVGKGKTFTFPGYTDTFNVLKARVVVCRDVTGEDECTEGKWHKNPKA